MQNQPRELTQWNEEDLAQLNSCIDEPTSKVACDADQHVRKQLVYVTTDGG